jgi:ADP-ribose pyrophosphatase
VQVELKRRILDDFFSVDEAVLRYQRFDGHMSEPVRRLRVERGDSVAAVVITVPDRQILLVEQFKYPTYGVGDGWVVELVAGMVDEGEQSSEAIRREIREEIGYETLLLEPVMRFYVSPGSTSERVALFYAEVDSSGNFSPGGGLPAEGEDIALRTFRSDEMWKALDEGRIEDAKTIIGLMWLRRHWVGNR